MALSSEHLLEWMTKFHGSRYELIDEREICPVCSEDLEGEPSGSDNAIVCKSCKIYVIGQSIANTREELFPREFNGDDNLHRAGNSVWCYNRHDELARNPLKREKNNPNHKFYHYQAYKRVYHFNERLKMRNNVEPRIPIDALLKIRVLVLAQLPLYYAPDDINSERVQIACRAIPALYKYAERWLQVRYFILLGELEYKEQLEQLYDIPNLTLAQQVQMSELFKEIEQVFDDALYVSSTKRQTKKDNQYGKRKADFMRRDGRPGYKLARHNLMQYNYVIHEITLILFGPEEYYRLRTDFCFPLHKSSSALIKLNNMMQLICARLSLECHQLPLFGSKEEDQLVEELLNEFCSDCGNASPCGCRGAD